jgi:Scramblase
VPISLTCDCGKKLTVKDELAGKRVRCPGCQATLTVAAAKSPAAMPKAAVGPQQKNGPPRAAAPPPVEEEEEERQEEEEPEEKPARRPAAQQDPDEEEQPRDEDDDLLDDMMNDDDESPKKKKPKDDEEEEEPVVKKKVSRKVVEEEEEEEEEEEVRPKGKKDVKGAKKAAKDEDEEEDEDEPPKKGKGKEKEKPKGKAKREVPPPMLQFNKFIIKAKTKAGKKTVEIVDAESNEVVANGANATGFMTKLTGGVIYGIKDETTGEPAFSVSRTGFLSKQDLVKDGKGRVVGLFKYKGSAMAGFEVHDEKKEHLCDVKGKLAKAEYKFVTPDGDDMATVSKAWGGTFKAILAAAGNFGVQFEEDVQADTKKKMILLGAALAVELIYQKGKPEKETKPVKETKPAKPAKATKKQAEEEEEEEE